MSFASDMQTVGSDLLSEFGELVTFKRISNVDFIPSTGAVPTGATTTFTAYGYPSNYTSAEIQSSSLIEYTDLKLTIESGSTPLIGDTARVNNTDYRVMDIRRVRAQASDIIYVLQLRV